MANDKGRGGPDGPDRPENTGGPDGTEQPDAPKDIPKDVPKDVAQDGQAKPDTPAEQPAQDAPSAPQPPQAAPQPPGPYGSAPQPPYGPGPYPGAGPGQPGWGQPGWGQPGWGMWGPPPAPKPGVVPLRPLNLGDIFGGTFAAFGRCWKALVGISALAFGGVTLAAVLAMVVAYLFVDDQLRDVFDLPDGVDPEWSEVVPLIVTFALVWVLLAVGMLVASALVSASVPAALQDAVLGKPSRFGEVWRRAIRRMPSVLGTVLLTWLITLVPFMLLIGLLFLVPALMLAQDNDPSGPVAVLWLLCLLAFVPLAMWLWVRFSLGPAVAVFESAGPVTALRRSARLVRDSWWRILGISLLMNVMAMIAAYIIQIPFNMIAMFSLMPGLSTAGPDASPADFLPALVIFLVMTLIGSMLSQMIMSLFPQLTLALLYVDERIRKESLDVSLAQAAGVPLTPTAPVPPGTPYQG